MKTVLLTAAAMLAFAANSILCRLALQGGYIDAASFMLVRVASGAIALLFLTLLLRSAPRYIFNWPAAALLSSYMASFSFGYVVLSTGTGALILFIAVQITMLTSAWKKGEYFKRTTWIGIVLAVSGLAYLLLPGNGAPNLYGTLLMMVAGISWGMYSLMGRDVVDPMAATTGNFLLATPLVFILWLPVLLAGQNEVSSTGLLLAAMSGVAASAFGYALWFAALRSLAASQAAIVQLSVPVIAGIGGVLLLSEAPTARFVLSSIATLGGIWLVLTNRSNAQKE